MAAFPGRIRPDRFSRSEQSGTCTRRYAAGSPPITTPTREPEASERALEVLLDSALEPIVDMVLLARGRRLRGACARRPGRASAAPDGRRLRGRRRRGRRTRSPTSRPTGSPASTPSSPTRTRTGATTPTRTRYDQIAQLFDHPRRARPLRDPLRRAQLGGPGRPPGRARLARRRPGPGAVRDRGQGRPRTTAWSRGRPGSSTSRPRSPQLLGVRRRAPTATYLAGQDGEVRRRRARPVGRGPRHVVGFLFDGTNPNVLYDMAAPGEAPNVARLIDDGHRVRARRDGRRCRPSRSPTTRRSSPAAYPGHHGILQQRLVRPRDRRAGDHQLAGHLAVGDADTSRPASSRSTTRCTARGPTRSPRR